MTTVAIIILVGVGRESDCGAVFEETDGVADSAMAAVDEAAEEVSVEDAVDVSAARAAVVILEMMVLVLHGPLETSLVVGRELKVPLASTFGNSRMKIVRDCQCCSLRIKIC